MVVELRRYIVLGAAILAAAGGLLGVVLLQEPSALLAWSRWDGTPGIGLAGALGYTIAGAALIGYPKARLIAGVLLIAGLLANASLLLAGVEWRTAGAVFGVDVLTMQAASDFGNFLAMFLSLVVLPQIFPEGLRTQLAWRLAFAIPLGVFALAAAAMVLDHLVFLPVVVQDVGWWSFFLSMGVGTLVGAASLVLRWRAASSMRWPVGLFAIASLCNAAVIISLWTPWMYQTVLPAVIMQGFYPPIAVIAIGAATLQYHLYDVQLVVRRAVVYGILTAIMAGSFFVVYGLLLIALSQEMISDRYRWLPVVAGLTVLAISWPMRVRLSAWLERRLLGERHDPLVALARLGSPGKRDARLLYRDVVRAVAVAVRSPQVALAVQRRQQLEVVAEYGGPPEDGMTVPLVHSGERLGELRIGSRTPGESYSRADQTLLDQLGRQTSALLYGLRRDTELKAARRKALAALANERERLGRDLHDSVAPLLAGAGLTAEALRRGMPLGTPDEQQAAQLAARLRSAATEVRRLAHDLQPGAVEGGLASAVSNHLNGLTGPTVPDFDLRMSVGELPPETSQAAYLVVLEAVNNALKHARAGLVRVEISNADDELRIAVIDDGIGLAEPYVSGLGITSMRSRVEALDGTFTLEPGRTRGTRLIARIPVHR